jgi:hypothetical protein
MRRSTYQLVEIPVANLHIAAVVVHALGELRGGLGALPLLALRILCRGGRGLLLGWRCGGAAREETADCVADGRADGDTTALRENPWSANNGFPGNSLSA